MFILVRESLPRWYGLSWRPNGVALVLSIHEEFLCRGKREGLVHPGNVGPIKNKFEFTSFDPSFETGFGFDGALVFERSENNFRFFIAPLPQIRKQLDEACENCGGTGRDEWREDACLWCRGEKKKVIHDHKPGFALSASLNLFFRAAYFIDNKTSSKLPQLFTVRLVTERGMHGAELGGMYGIEFVNWLRGQPMGRNLNVMTEAMWLAHNRLIGNNLYDSHNFRASVHNEDGWLNVTCPGDGCGLNPGSRGIDPGRGYEFSSHNVDNPHQQLTLLAGLAALHERVDQELSE